VAVSCDDDPPALIADGEADTLTSRSDTFKSTPPGRAAGFIPHAPHEADHLHMVLGLVAAGAGVNGQITYRALHRLQRDWNALAWPRDDKSPALAEFISTRTEC